MAMGKYHFNLFSLFLFHRGGALGAQVMAMGKYHFTLRLENISQNTLVGIAYTDVSLTFCLQGTDAEFLSKVFGQSDADKQTRRDISPYECFFFCLSLSADTNAHLPRIHVDRTQVNLNDGASRRNVVLKENGEFWVFGEKRCVGM